MTEQIDSITSGTEKNEIVSRLSLAVAVLGMTMGISPDIALAAPNGDHGLDNQPPIRLTSNYIKIGYTPIETTSTTTQVKRENTNSKPVLPSATNQKPGQRLGDALKKSRQGDKDISAGGQYPPQ
ncbi:MAG: hypothetical protein ACOZB0_07365 [Pseudomonadota bacterium]